MPLTDLLINLAQLDYSFPTNNANLTLAECSQVCQLEILKLSNGKVIATFKLYKISTLGNLSYNHQTHTILRSF